MKISLHLIATALLLAGCSNSTPVSVNNKSGATLENVVISGSGFEQNLGDIGAGMTATTTVSPKGESGMKISFNSKGRSVSLLHQATLKGGGQYAVTVIVAPDLGANVDANLHPY